MKICLTVPSLDRRFGGPIESAFGLAGGLRDNGHEVLVVGCGETGADVSIPSWGRFHSTPIPRRTRPITQAVEGSDILHVLGYRDPVGTVAMAFARRRGIPYVFEPLGMYRPVERSLLIKRTFERVVGRNLLKHAGAIVTTSGLEAEQFEGAPELKALLSRRPNGIHPGSLTTDLPPGAIRERFGIPPHAPLVISLARVTRKKRIDHLVDAVALLDDHWLLIAGPDSNDGGMQDIDKRHQNSPARGRIVVRPEGLWGGDKVRAILDSDCFCLPSAWETSSIALLEAGALETPIVASDRCGGTEYLGRAAIVAPFGDIEATASAITKALRLREQPDTLRAESIRIKSELDWAVVARRQLAIYEKASKARGETASL